MSPPPFRKTPFPNQFATKAEDGIVIQEEMMLYGLVCIPQYSVILDI